MYAANGLALFFIQSRSLSAWRREDGTCSASVGTAFALQHSYCDLSNMMLWLGYHSPSPLCEVCFNSFFFFSQLV